MVMIAASRQERGLIAEMLRDIQPHHITVKRDRAVKISHLEMNMSYGHFRVRLWSWSVLSTVSTKLYLRALAGKSEGRARFVRRRAGQDTMPTIS